jgi:hypothetical protein
MSTHSRFKILATTTLNQGRPSRGDGDELLIATNVFVVNVAIGALNSTLASHCARNASVIAERHEGMRDSLTVSRAYLLDSLLCFASHTPIDCSAMK